VVYFSYSFNNCFNLTWLLSRNLLSGFARQVSRQWTQCRLSKCYVDPPGRGEEKGKSNFVNLGLLLVFLNGSKKFYRKSNLQTNEFSNSNSCCFNKTVIQYFAFGEEIKSLMLRKLNCNF
jgi:hypothetical protein